MLLLSVFAAPECEKSTSTATSMARWNWRRAPHLWPRVEKMLHRQQRTAEFSPDSGRVMVWRIHCRQQRVASPGIVLPLVSEIGY
eukprot:COSAG01_NODE_672_length_14331_cov_88.368092_3_plen_85_part_00